MRQSAKWRALKRYFSGPNIVRELRNKVSFHSDVATTSSGFDALSTDAELVDYLAKHQGNALYFGGEFLSLLSMIELSSLSDPKDAIDDIVTQTIEKAGLLGDIINEYVGAFGGRYLKS